MRRVLLTLVLCLLWSVRPVDAAVALVSGQIAYDDTTPFDTDGTGVVTLPGACTMGNTLLVGIGIIADVTISSVTDGGGNTYATDAGLTITGGGTTAEVWIYWAPCTSAATVVTVTLTAPSSSPSIVLVAEFSGLNNSDLLEDTTEVVDTASPYNSGDVVTTVNDSLLFGVINSDSGADYTDEAGWTPARDWAGGLVSYKILSATATDNWDPTSAASENSAQVMGAFNGTAAGGSSGCRHMALLGVGGTCAD